MIVLGMTLRQSQDPAFVRTGYQIMVLIDDVIVIPTALLTLLSGIVSGLSSNWGVLKHHWVVAKLGLVLLAMANGFFFLHEWTGRALAEATGPAVPATGHAVRTLLIAGNLAAFILLVVATILSIYKPWGRTPRGRRADAHRQRRRVGQEPTAGRPDR
ncbi:membrane protein [Planobispora takensis]|uniref:Membrane protein n=2 Tax=Planobispora takensis TaxID=1367882 RepID=A0A8J3SWR9_9ACTN|nr:membrane protein [Planobispora takensis]